VDEIMIALAVKIQLACEDSLEKIRVQSGTFRAELCFKFLLMQIQEAFKGKVHEKALHSLRARFGNLGLVGDLVQVGEEELLKTRGFGSICLKQVKAVLAEKGLSLGMKLSPEMVRRINDSFGLQTD
jgi:hypothetical protein